MSQICVENLKKTYRVAERKAGLKGAFAGLFRRKHRMIEALAGISFELQITVSDSVTHVTDKLIQIGDLGRGANRSRNWPT